MKVFIDSNIPMYVARREHPIENELSADSRKEKSADAEAPHPSMSRLDLAREVYDLFVEVCPVVLGVTLADTDRARDLVCEGLGPSARDAVHAAVMLNNYVR